MVPRKLLESKRTEVAGGWTELHKDEHRLYCSSMLIGDQVNVDERGTWRVGRMVGGEKACTLLTGKPEGKRPLGRPRRRWKSDVKPDRKKYLDRIFLYQNK
jgi:hypothetical protein